MKISEADFLVLPGLGNSGPEHWQRRWAQRFANGHVVEQTDWHHPTRDAWVETILTDIRMATRPVVLIAHSLGTIAVAHVAARLSDTKVRGAFLVSARLRRMSVN